jgi:hypothetical protein
MGIANEFKKRIEKQEQFIEKLQKEMDEISLQMREARAYMQALQDMCKLVPKDDQSEESPTEVNIRAGSLVAKARDALKLKGARMHVSDLMTAIGLEHTKKNRLSLSGSLSNYVREKKVFSRPAPNVFGLLEWSQSPVGELMEDLVEIETAGVMVKGISKHPN